MMRNKTVAPIAISTATAPNKGGRPPYQRDERAARQVEAMAGYGIPVGEIARLIGVAENTLRKYYPDEIDVGATKANAKVIEALFRKATGDGPQAVTAAIFWAKTRCRWKETTILEHAIVTQEQRDAAVAAAWVADG